MRRIVIAYAVATGCGGEPAQSTIPASGKSLHSPELDQIMKDEVNQPYSALVFNVFHSENEIDYSAIAIPSTVLRTGIAKVRDIADPPVATNEARSVFFTYLESLARDAERFHFAAVHRDRQSMEAALERLGKTCNNCHHFFRLKIEDAATD
jgi:cytochrome c556